MLLQILTDAPSPTTLTIKNGSTDTGYELLAGAEWGNAVWEHQYSGARGTQGARASQGTPQNRPLVLPIRVAGVSMDNLAARLSTLHAATDELRRFGGRVKWKATGETYAQYFQLMTGSSALSEWGSRAETTYRAVMLFQAACAPYLLGDSLDIADDFSTDTIADYTLDAGSGTLSVSGGQLVPSSTAAKRARHTGRGYTYGDTQATLKVTTGASASGTAGVTLKNVDASNRLEVYTDGTNLKVDKVVAGASTNLASTAVTVAASTTYWVRGRIEGNVVTAEWFASEPTPMGTPTTTTSYALSTSEAAVFGSAIAGSAGFKLTPAATDWRLDDFRVEPFTYRNRTLPERLPLAGTIPGDAPALADISVTHSGGSAAPVFGLLGWSKRPEAHNLVWNGDFEDSGTDGWSGATGPFVTGSSTLSRVTTSAYAGAASMQTVTPAALDAGAFFSVYRTFRKGVTYTASFMTRAASSTTSMVAVLGAADGSSYTAGTAFALSTTWTLQTVSWTPTADVSVGALSIKTNAATATTFLLDAIQVYEGTTAPTIGSHAIGAGGYPPFGILEAEACDSGDLANWAITSSASYRSGYWLTHATATSATAGWWIDPNLLVPDDYTMGELNVEVWARVLVDSAATSPKYTLSVRPEAGTSYGTERFTLEYGSAGKSVTKPSSSTAARFVRLGTLPMLVDRVSPRRWKLWLAYSHTGSATSGIDYLVLVPSRQRAVSPSGKVNDTTYPKFTASTSETTRVIRSDLSGRTAKPPANPHPDTGLGGELIEIPYGAVDGLVKLSSLSPDDPTSDTTTEQLSHAATVHYAITPRWAMLRGAS